MIRVRRAVEAAKIIAFCVAAAVIYGILHDMVTANVCVEYFTIAHPPVFPTENPFLLAFGWGVIATWWVGLPLGILLAAASQIGPNPIAFLDLRRRIVFVMLISAAAALVCGLVGLTLGLLGRFPLTLGWNSVIPPAGQARFAFDAWAHLASYGFGALGGLALIVITAFSRASSFARRSI